MTGAFADRLFRIAFALAGFYNLAFGFWAGLWPSAFFEWFAIAPPRYPGIWACLGMVVGVYGLLYWYASWRLDAAWPIIAVGLLGKTLGPIGMAFSIGDDWPRRLALVCVYNDVIWWLPFGLFLVRGTLIGRQVAQFAPWICVVLHAAALALMAVVLQPGTLKQPEVAVRGAYIAEHAAAWTTGWSVWMLTAMSLVGFYAWWGSRLDAATLSTMAVLIAAFGMVCDLSGEALSVLMLVESAPAADIAQSASAWNAAGFLQVERIATLLTAGAANALYTLSGMLLMFATRDLPGWVRAAMWGTWLAGLAMTVAGVVNHVGGMMVATAMLFPLLICWISWMGARWERA
jgi:hypothetical protein